MEDFAEYFLLNMCIYILLRYTVYDPLSNVTLLVYCYSSVIWVLLIICQNKSFKLLSSLEK